MSMRVGLRAFDAMPKGVFRSSCPAPFRAMAFSQTSSVLPRLQPQKRSVSTESYTEDENMQLLNKQRATRPISPHFTIYEPQLSWYSSIANRITGAGLSTALYGVAISYVALPVIGFPFDSQSLVSLVGALPTSLKVIGKLAVGGAFWFHFFNGLRHLSWDMGYFLTVKASWNAGYTVLGATGVATIFTAFFV